MNALLWAMIAHALVEFVFVTNAARTQRALFHPGVALRTSLTGYAWHAGIYAAVLMGFLWYTQGRQLLPALLCAILAALLCVLIDIGEEFARQRFLLERSLSVAFGAVDRGLHQMLLFIVGQGLHFLALRWATGLIYPPAYTLSDLSWYVQNHLLGPAPVPDGHRIPYVLLLGLVSTFGAAEFIRLLVRIFAPVEPARKVTVTRTILTENTRTGSTGAVPGRAEQADALALNVNARTQRVEEYEEPIRTATGSGRWIGILERTLVIILVAMNAWQGIAFVFTAKSLARYKQLDNRDFAEYYIVGTLVSILIGIAGGLLIREALGPLA